MQLIWTRLLLFSFSIKAAFVNQCQTISATLGFYTQGKSLQFYFHFNRI